MEVSEEPETLLLDPPTQKPDEAVYVNMLAGGISGVFSKTATAPLARLTILYQVTTFLAQTSCSAEHACMHARTKRHSRNMLTSHRLKALKCSAFECSRTHICTGPIPRQQCTPANPPLAQRAPAQQPPPSTEPARAHPCPPITHCTSSQPHPRATTASPPQSVITRVPPSNLPPPLPVPPIPSSTRTRLGTCT